MTQANEQVKHWLAQLGAQIGVALSLDDEGLCSLTAGEDLTVDVICPPGDTCFYLNLTLLDLTGQSSREMVLQQALTMNLFQQETAGAAIALDPDAEALMLCFTQPVEGTQFSTFNNILTNLVTTGRQLKGQLEAASREQAAPQPSNAAAFNPAGPGAYGIGAQPAQPVYADNPHEHLLHMMNLA
ncbi:CesT family type III secretion system chaperone [Acanthopleuribacter pedis]|uniref:CesT family type III secretion system chaperone n=1 Tax=Acanthopleuribacter pedis TaxID=442870 RepID=A0A8J7QPL8_9BACT|nr:CesT family type III secretion system chaperone [Acanthopleuribacter pedis]MBO1322328.1 CesT family type III secretion system chaperone [Acanthopleuribacter pedis]